MKTSITATDCSRQGSALVTTMLVIMVSAVAAGSMYSLSSSMANRVRFMTDDIAAKAIAEAGANQAYSILRNQFYTGANNPDLFPLTTFGGGTYQVTVLSATNGVIRLVSEGLYGRGKARVGLDMRDTFWDESGGPPFLSYAIFANGSLRFNGNPPTIDGGLHTNMDWILNGTYDNVTGLISAQNSASIPEAYRAVWQLIPFPKLDDPEFQEFLAAADDLGILTRMTGDQTFPRSIDFDGVVVIEGNVIFRGSGDRTINGMLYVTGDITSNGSGSMTLNGMLLAGGNILYNGAAGIFTHQDVIASDDDGNTDDNAYVVVSGWWQD